MGKNKNRKPKQRSSRIRKNFSDDFKSVFIVIATLLQSSIFLLLCDHCIDLINDFSVMKLSYFILHFCVFIRIIQTHLLAAIKYSETWTLFPLDFVLVFLTAMFEYVLIKSDAITQGTQDQKTSVLIMGFCIYGIIGYGITLSRIVHSSDSSTRKRECTLQGWNIAILVFIFILHSIVWISSFSFPFLLVNFLTSILVGINVYLSMSLSMYKLTGQP